MGDGVKLIGTPPLRPIWQVAKKNAEVEAKKLKEADKFSALEKKFKKALGPDLEGWPKLYPNYPKLQTARNELTTTITAYRLAVKQAGLNAKVAKLMTDALGEIDDALTRRLSTAEDTISQDLKLGLAMSRQKMPVPITLFNQDIAKQVQAAAGSEVAKVIKVERILLDATFGDVDILAKAPDDKDDILSNEMRSAADFSRVVNETAEALKKAAVMVRKDPKAGDAAQAFFEKEYDRIVAQAMDRAAVPILTYAKVRVNNTKFKLKTAAKLTLTITGALGGLVGLALTPLTAGASTIAGAYGLFKAAVSIGEQIGQISAEAEEVAGSLARKLDTLQTQYKNASETRVGVQELGKKLVNTVLPTEALTSLSGAKSDSELLGNKVGNLKVQVHEMSSKLNTLLDKQAKTQKLLGEFETSAKATLGKDELKVLVGLIHKLESSTELVTRSIEQVGAMYLRVTRTDSAHKRLSNALGQVAGKQPTWSQVGEVVFDVASSLGFLLAGNVNAPDPYSFAKLGGTIVQHLGNAQSSLETLEGAVSSLSEIVKQRQKGK